MNENNSSSKELNQWTPEPENIEDLHGFVYDIVEIDTSMHYIGIKRFWVDVKKSPTKYKMKDGKWLKDKKGKRILETRTTRKHSKVESDWRTYNSSSPIMIEKLENNPEKYYKTILRLCKSQSELKMYEAYLQLKTYFDGKWNTLYNEVINLRLRVPKEKKRE